MDKPAPADPAIHPLIAARWSPRAFDSSPLDPRDVDALLEAARWAPSSVNEQPWSFLLASIEDPETHARLVAALTPGNQVWASKAPLLLATVAATRFAKDGRDNAHAWHDVGLATALLMVEATARGLFVHPMGGFSAEKVREGWGLPEDQAPVAVLAVGRAGDLQDLPEPQRSRELLPRVRKERSSFVFGGRWGQPPGTR